VPVDLVLGELGAYTPPPGGAVPLVLGETEGLSGVLTDVTFSPTLRITGSISAAQLQPFPGGSARLRWDGADRTHAALPEAPWGAIGDRRDTGPTLPWGAFDGLRSVRSRVLPWGVAATSYRATPVLPWDAAAPARVARRLPWGVAAPARYGAVLPWEAATPARRRAEAPWQAATRRLQTRRLPWERADYLPAVNRPIPVGPDDYGFTPRGTGPVHLHFCEDAGDTSLDLVFNDEVCITQPRFPDGYVIAARNTYMHTHALTAFRLPDLTPVPITGFTLSADDGSFGWTCTATGPVEVLTLLAPTGVLPARLRVGLDGMIWEFIVEGLRRNREFGRTTATITCRSATALLGDPYFAEQSWLNAVPVTAQQIIDDALFATDVTLDWQCTDWTVPAGVWSHFGTPLSVVRRVADSIGAIVESPRTGDTVTVRPRYPLLPWDWTAPLADVTIALDAVTSEGYERADKPAYEGVYISGQQQGILALVKRTGTAPALLLPTVTDALITHEDAARQRGEAMLGPTGPMATMSVTLPVLTGLGEPGVINPGQIIALDGWVGLVRSVSVTVGLTVVRQTLTVERHL
jgi:hypothetical protein